MCDHSPCQRFLPALYALCSACFGVMCGPHIEWHPRVGDMLSLWPLGVVDGGCSALQLMATIISPLHAPRWSVCLPMSTTACFLPASLAVCFGACSFIPLTCTSLPLPLAPSQVEYLPARSLDVADTVLKEFIATWQDFIASHASRSTAGSGNRPPGAAAAAVPSASAGGSLNGRFVAIEPNFTDFNLPASDFSWQHKALQLVLASAYLMAARP